MFMTVKQAAEKWGISDRRVRILCAEGKIPGAYQKGRGWKIPENAVKPADGRLSGLATLSDKNIKKRHQSNFRLLVEDGLVCPQKEDKAILQTTEKPK